jgi:hypothetical protein
MAHCGICGGKDLHEFYRHSYSITDSHENSSGGGFNEKEKKLLELTALVHAR